jgi:O-acetyl-ADP-ribose deacetylase
MSRIEIVKDDITTLAVDAIVNAANNSLLGGGGVDGAIHRAGGPEILAECMEIRHRQGGCKTGEAVITSAGKMKAKYVIHTVGPVWHGGGKGEEKLLADSYDNSLLLAIKHRVLSIAFPNISTGVYGFPKEQAASIALRQVKTFLDSHSDLQRVIFCCFDDENYTIYKSTLQIK